MVDCTGALWMLKDTNIRSGQTLGLKITILHDVLYLFQDTHRWFTLLLHLSGPLVTHPGVTHLPLFMLKHIR